MLQSVPERTMLQSVPVRSASNGSRLSVSWQRHDALVSYQLLSPTMLRSVPVGITSNFEQTLDLLAEMRRINLAPDVIIYNAAIRACEKCKQWQHAFCSLAETRSGTVLRNVTTYNSVISASENCQQGCRHSSSWQIHETFIYGKRHSGS